MIAWLIGLSQAVCGAGEACVRAPSALAWAVTAAATAAVAGTLYGRRAAVWAGLAALLAPGAVYSARIISTDAPLLAFWALALLAWVRLRAGGHPAWGGLLAMAFGAGLLSKYAMLYFVGGLLVAAWADPASRAALRRPPVWIGLIAGALCLAPNLAWQAAHGLATLRHTADNVGGGGATPGLADGLAFLAAQAVLASPVVFAAACAVLWRAARGSRIDGNDRMLLAFSAPIILLVTGVAFITRAHANWAATALVAVFVLGAAVLARRGARGWMAGGLAFGLLLQIALPLADANADRLSVGGRAVFEPVLGWRAFAETAGRQAERAGAAVIVAESRRDAAALLYYGRDRKTGVAVWPSPGARPEDHFQMERPLTTAAARRGPVLAVSGCPGRDRFADWERVDDLGELTAASGPGPVRRWRLYRLEGPPAAISRPPPCDPRR